MKLNPPDTAPKDGFCAILALFEGDWESRLAIWLEADVESEKEWSGWVVSDAHREYYADVSEGTTQIYFETEYREHEKMIGWLPIPQLDEQGNVT